MSEFLAIGTGAEGWLIEASCRCTQRVRGNDVGMLAITEELAERATAARALEGPGDPPEPEEAAELQGAATREAY